jgi:CDP-paratose 2-epimerase
MKVIITGVAGFIGGHVAASYLAEGATVVGVDNLGRRGNTQNLEWLSSEAQSRNGRMLFVHSDIRSQSDMDRLFALHTDANAVIHLAGQVAVTTSVVDPRSDFEANALGTLNILEGVRRFCPEAVVLYSSTNKVYGDMEPAFVEERNGRYQYRDLPCGIDETTPLDFHSPYGCSKGAGDQYMRDYARIYGLKTVVLRQSCIYGTRQFGIEDQGWVAWFTIASVLNKPITLYGDGKQVRDVLWVEDLVRLYRMCVENGDKVAGKVYNVGGGSNYSLSLRELLGFLSELSGQVITHKQADWRPGDQRCFVADIRRVHADLGWEPTVTPVEGVQKLWKWTRQNETLLRSVLGDL